MLASAAKRLMASGGDKRIALDPETGLNQYFVAPQPTDAIAFSSSTANDISAPAFAEVQRRLARIAPKFMLGADAYAEALEDLRTRIRAVFRLHSDTGVVFAASGTDLEYVGLSAAYRSQSRGIDNILLGSDEVGSGCILSSRGAHFADQTPLGLAVERGAAIDPEGADFIRLFNISARDAGSGPVPSEDILLEIGAIIEAAITNGRHPLVHIIHGSKTGLILPSLAHIDALRRRYGAQISFVVDACQCRLGLPAVAAYLARGVTVFLTGSKFMGGPPFSGFALVPRIAAGQSSGVLPGFERIFNRSEWPADWLGVERLPHGANLGLLLRLEASIYELELFQRLTAADVRRTLDLFDEAIETLTARVGAPRLLPYAFGEWQATVGYPIEMRTLVTLDLGQTRRAIDFGQAQTIHRMLMQNLRRYACGRDNQGIAARPIKLGQPVKCVTLPDGTVGGTLRIGLSMPQMVEFAAMDSATLRTRLHSDMAAVATKIDIIRDL